MLTRDGLRSWLAVLPMTAAEQATHRRQQRTEVRASRAAPFSILKPSLVLDWQKKILRVCILSRSAEQAHVAELKGMA